MLNDRQRSQPERVPTTHPPFAIPRPAFDRLLPREATIDEPSSAFSRIALGIAPDAIDTLIEQLPVAVLIADRDGHVVYANKEARTLRVQRLERIQWAVTRALLTEDQVREDDIEFVADGQPRRWLTALVTPLRRPGVGVHAAFVIVSDVTARKRMAEWTPVIETLVNL